MGMYILKSLFVKLHVDSANTGCSESNKVMTFGDPLNARCAVTIRHPLCLAQTLSDYDEYISDPSGASCGSYY